MSLRDDLDAMERHKANGTLREWFLGTAPILDIDGRVVATPVFDDDGNVTRYNWKTPRGNHHGH